MSPVPDDDHPLARMMADAKAAHDRQHMQAEATLAQINGFLGRCSVEDLLALRKMLALGKHGAVWLDGQAHALLVHVHHVDPVSGEDPAAKLLGAETAPCDRSHSLLVHPGDVERCCMSECPNFGKEIKP